MFIIYIFFIYKPIIIRKLIVWKNTTQYYFYPFSDIINVQMKNPILMNLCCLQILLTTIIARQLFCKEGVTMLTRKKISDGKYSLQNQCLCPIDFIGRECNNHRNIHCYLTKKSITPSQITEENYSRQMNLTLQLYAQCYIEKTIGQYVTLLQFMMQRQLTKTKLNYELDSDPDSEIIWANNINLFQDNGTLKYIQGYNYTIAQNGTQIMSQEDERNILSKYEPVKFDYTSSFLGFPLSNSKLYVTSKIIRPTQNKIFNKNQPLVFTNQDEFIKMINRTSQIQKAKDLINDISVEELVNDLDKAQEKLDEAEKNIRDITDIQIIPSFKTTITVKPQEAAQLKNIRIQVSVMQMYREDLYSSYIGINAAQFILPVRVPGMAQAKVYSVNFNKKQISRFVYFILLLILFGIGYLIFWLKKRRSKQALNKIKNNVDQLEDDLPWK